MRLCNSSAMRNNVRSGTPSPVMTMFTAGTPAAETSWMIGSSVSGGNQTLARSMASRNSLSAAWESMSMSNSAMIVAAFSLENVVYSVMPSSALSSTSAGLEIRRSESSGEMPS